MHMYNLPVKIYTYSKQHVKKQMISASWPEHVDCGANEGDNWGNHWANKTAVVTWHRSVSHVIAAV